MQSHHYHPDSEGHSSGVHKWVFRIAVIAAVLWYLFGATGCYGPKKLNRQLAKGQAIYPTVVANACSSWYPPKIIDSTHTEYIQGRLRYLTDTLTTTLFSHDTVVQVRTVNHYSSKTDTIVQYRLQTVENTAKVDALQGELNQTKADLNITNGKLQSSKKFGNWCFWIGLAGWVLIIGVTAIRIFKPKLIS